MEENAALSQLIFQVMQQRHDAVALRLLPPGETPPAEALRPWRQTGRHLALCQAFALARRDGKTVYMAREDHWCWAPLVALSAVDCPPGSEAFSQICGKIGIGDRARAEAFVAAMPRLPRGAWDGLLIAPLAAADFAPDIVLINGSAVEVRTLLLALKAESGRLLPSAFDPLDSCVWSVVQPLLDGEYRLTLPDPGDSTRALTDPDDLIFTVPARKLPAFRRALEAQRDRGGTTDSFRLEMRPDFPRPPFYNDLFRQWGLDQGEDWERP